ncbi:dihydrofolate reductase family protein [Marinimicrobium sp. ABcell2]|uniref:dihydrofolate reductase family protein n=1 Tax=Marinimicrobium sp. ABcell2 TaxID=3069751 RepID=UPI0027B4206D|nr:dihydrofolate reductase family protein [Marinimicrobium sp. ABcell2]MDQ2077209.1 dihydrofolate reductase family protein [Marinimicrobium sp. ABcell2]
MAHVIHSINTTASGLCHHLDSIIDDAHHQYAIDLARSADALVLGRNTFDLFMEFWPNAATRSDLPEMTAALANALNTVPKLVISSRPIELTWNNTNHVRGPDLEPLKNELTKLAGTVVIFGSPRLATSLLNEGLINEIHILTQPFIGTEGPQAYRGLKKRAELDLIGTTQFPTGSVLLRYNVT